MVQSILLAVVSVLSIVPARAEQLVGADRVVNTSNNSSIVQIGSCPTETLRVVLNVDNASSKADLLKTMKIFASYPQLQFTPARSDGSSVAFLVRAEISCESSECVRGTGFTELQWRLKPLAGVQIVCSDVEAPVGAPGQEAARPQQEQKQDGGVTTTN